MKMKQILMMTVAAYCLTMTGVSRAALIEFDLQGQAGSGLLGGNVIGSPVNSGSGGEIGAGITYDDVSKILNIQVGWGSGNGFSDLSSTVTVAHIHGPASELQNAGVQIGLAPGLSASAFNGGVVLSSSPLSAGQENDLLAGLWYINIHTSTNPGGEIRGNMIAIPEPASIGLLGLISGGIYFARRFFIA